MSNATEPRGIGGAEYATELSQPYWHALAEGRLVLQHCKQCGRHQHFPRHLCRWCGSRALEWTAATGAGEVLALTTVHRSSRPALRERLPYDLAVVRTDEGPLLLCVAVGVGPSGDGGRRGSQAWGKRVVIDFERTLADRLLTVRSA